MTRGPRLHFAPLAAVLQDRSDKVGDREFQFDVIGPLPSFVTRTGGSIGVIAALPRAPTLVSAVGLTVPNNPGSEIAKVEAELGLSHLIGERD